MYVPHIEVGYLQKKQKSTKEIGQNRPQKQLPTSIPHPSPRLIIFSQISK